MQLAGLSCFFALPPTDRRSRAGFPTAQSRRMRAIRGGPQRHCSRPDVGLFQRIHNLPSLSRWAAATSNNPQVGTPAARPLTHPKTLFVGPAATAIALARQPPASRLPACQAPTTTIPSGPCRPTSHRVDHDYEDNRRLTTDCVVSICFDSRTLGKSFSPRCTLK